MNGMIPHPLTKAFAILLIVTLVAPATFFIAPQKTSAAGGILGAIGCIGGITGLASGVGSAASSVLSVPVSNLMIESQTAVSAGADSTSCVNDTILMPLARAVARMILAQITASTINWITGRNGTGQASFVQNVSVHLQGVGDAVAIPFFNQVTTGFNSPFGPAISSALRLNYAQQTSVAGFFAANQSTLARSSPNPGAFLAGNWSQGGIGSWFALTTQTQNNPYTLYQAAQTQLGNNVGQAQANRRQDMAQSGGFLSWCGASNTEVDTSNVTCPSGQTLSSDTNQCYYSSGANAGQFSGATPAASSAKGVSPGAACFNSDGTPGTIQTPGSTIHDYTQKIVVGAGIDQLVSAQDLDVALGAIATALVGQVISGSGLFGASRPSSGRPAVVNQLQSYSANNGSAATSATSLAQTTLANVATYTGIWNSISAAANTASTTLGSLANFCTTAAAAATDDPNFAAAATAQAAAARAAIPASIAPVIAQAQTAINAVAATQAFALKTQTDAVAATSATAATSGAGGTLSADVQTLAAMPPSTSDVADAQMKATVTNRATANPTGSLAVSGGTLVDQMNLINTNAEALKTSACVKPARSTPARDTGD